MMRVGIGYDVHRLRTGRRLVLGGVEIPSEIGLEGHSDADVVLHAVIDAVLGAAGQRDIGHHFPPTDDSYRDISSLELLRKAHDIVRASGYRVLNVDVSLVAEAPRVGPYVDKMCERISATLGIDPDAVNVKATTNEGVGPEGRREAMSAQAVALLGKSG